MGVVVDAALEVLEVHPVAAVDELEGALLGHAADDADVGVEAVVARRLHEHLAAGGAEGAQGADDAGVDAGRVLDGVGVDLEPVAPAVPVDDRGLVGGGNRQVAVVLVPDPLAEGFGDGRGDAEVLVGGAHADLDLVGAVAGDLGVPLRRVGPDAAVDGVEVVAAVLPDGAAPALRRKGNGAADGARDRGHAGGAQEGAPVEPTELGHLWTPLVLPRRSSSTAVRASPLSCRDPRVRPEHSIDHPAAESTPVPGCTTDSCPRPRRARREGSPRNPRSTAAAAPRMMSAAPRHSR